MERPRLLSNWNRGGPRRLRRDARPVLEPLEGRLVLSLVAVRNLMTACSTILAVVWSAM